MRASALPVSEAVWIVLNEVFRSDRMPQSSIEIRLPGWQSRQGRGYGRILVRPVQPRAGQQRDPAVVEAGVHAISVVLDLMQPLRALRRRVYQFAKLWLDPLWKIWRRAARLIGRRFCHHSRAGSVGQQITDLRGLGV
jgi:hypothetical protein